MGFDTRLGWSWTVIIPIRLHKLPESLMIWPGSHSECKKKKKRKAKEKAGEEHSWERGCSAIIDSFIGTGQCPGLDFGEPQFYFSNKFKDLRFGGEGYISLELSTM